MATDSLALSSYGMGTMVAPQCECGHLVHEDYQCFNPAALVVRRRVWILGFIPWRKTISVCNECWFFGDEVL